MTFYDNDEKNSVKQNDDSNVHLDPVLRAKFMYNRINHYKQLLAGFIDCQKTDKGFIVFDKKSLSSRSHAVDAISNGLKLRHCNFGDTVIALVARVSSSQSTWCKFLSLIHISEPTRPY